MRAVTLALVLATAMFHVPARAAQQTPPAEAAAPRPDARMKLDLLVVVAHPDDETAIASYLAKAVFDEGRRVGVAYVTDGEGGGNQVATERAAALGDVRQIETRRALAELGIDQCWFLTGRDTATQNVLFSLANWPEGPVLEEVVRLVRLTRPEVVVTWLPRPVAGENHGDHQASGVVATEAFDVAGDPTAFAGQLAPPRLRLASENLRPWQPKKLYYFSDAFDTTFLAGAGPEYAAGEVSPSRKAPYAYFAARASSHHLSQFAPGFPQPVLDAIRSNDAAATMALLRAERKRDPEPVRLALGKSRVGGSRRGDVFEAVTPAPVAWVPVARTAPAPRSGVSLSLDGPWAFYRDFWRAHDVEWLASPEPLDVSVRPASELHVPLRLRNDSPATVAVTVIRTSALPAGWVEAPAAWRYRLAPGDEVPIDAVMTTAAASDTPVQVTYAATVDGSPAGSVTLRVLVRAGTMPQ